LGSAPSYQTFLLSGYVGVRSSQKFIRSRKCINVGFGVGFGFGVGVGVGVALANCQLPIANCQLLLFGGYNQRICCHSDSI
jgi:hypothetical protein